MIARNCPQCRNQKFFFDKYHQNAFPEAYAMCKWCGYWKKEGEDPKRCNMFFCGCPGSIRDREGYDWGFGDEVNCQSCKRTLNKKNHVQWPVDDPKHPFHKR